MDPIIIAGITVIVVLVAWMFYRWLNSDDGEIESHIAYLESEHREREAARVRVELKELREQADHLARVQMLLLEHLSLSHEIQPQQDRLVKTSKEK